MKKRIVRMILVFVLVVNCVGSFMFNLPKYQATEEVYPFRWYQVEKCLSDIWVGDTLTLKADYTYELQEGAELVTFNSTEIYSAIYYTISFNAEGIVKMKAIRNSDSAERVFEFKVGPAKERKYESKIPESIKIGYQLPSVWFEYLNCHLEDSVWPAVMAPAYDEFCMLPWGSYGVATEAVASRNKEAARCNSYSEWQWLFGVATRPGVMYYTTEFEPDKKYAIKIEEPVINTNFPTEIRVGNVLEITTRLENTELINKKVEDVKKIIEGYTTRRYFSDLIGYQPRIEIVSGCDLIKREGGDYSNILSSTEKITFLNEGTVVFRVVYEMLPIPVEGMLKLEAVYSPEETYTVTIISESVVPEESEEADEPEEDTPTKEPETSETPSTEQEPETEEQPETEPEPNTEDIPSTEEVPSTEDDSSVEEDYVVEFEEEKKVISKVEFEAILNENKDKDVVIQSSADLEFTFTKGSMSEVEDMEDYDFGTAIETEFEAKVEYGEKVNDDNFISRINFNYEGKLPGMASIRIHVGAEQKGVTLYYSKLCNDGTIKFIYSAVVDENGYITVKQDSCSDYILTTERVDDKAEKDNVTGQKDNENGVGDVIGVIFVIIAIVAAAVALFFVLKRKGWKLNI